MLLHEVCLDKNISRNHIETTAISLRHLLKHHPSLKWCEVITGVTQQMKLRMIFIFHTCIQSRRVSTTSLVESVFVESRMEFPQASPAIVGNLNVKYVMLLS